MKTVVAIFTTLLSLNSFAVESSILTKKQTQNVLTEIDNICGDTWCEGEFNWSFDNIICNQEGACTLTATAIGYDYENDKEYNVLTKSCTIQGSFKYDQMIDHSKKYSHLKNDFYYAVSDCVTEIEDKAWDLI